MTYSIYIRFPKVSNIVADRVDKAILLGLFIAGGLHTHPILYFQSFFTLWVLFCGVVFGFACLVHLFVKSVGTKLQVHKTQGPQYGKEVMETSLALYVFACLGAYALTNHKLGMPIAYCFSLREAQPWAPDSTPLYMVQLLVATLVVDFYQYWRHYWFHHPKLFAFHRGHHAHHNPSSFGVFAFQPVEALFFFGPVLSACLPNISLWAQAYFLWAGGLMLIGIFIHCGYEVPLIENTLASVFIGTSVFHNLHHERSKCNFGEVLYIWDYFLHTGYHKYGYNSKLTNEKSPNYRSR